MSEQPLSPEDCLPVYKIVEPITSLTLHVNHPELGMFIIHRPDQNSISIEDLDKLVAFIKHNLSIKEDANVVEAAS